MPVGGLIVLWYVDLCRVEACRPLRGGRRETRVVFSMLASPLTLRWSSSV